MTYTKHDALSLGFQSWKVSLRMQGIPETIFLRKEGRKEVNSAPLNVIIIYSASKWNKK
jgi:hypothetical protein